MLKNTNNTADTQITFPAGSVFNTVTLIHGSCADETVDAVVNAANKYLAAGGGLCGRCAPVCVFLRSVPKCKTSI